MRPPATHKLTSAIQTRSSIAWLVPDAASSVDFVAAASRHRVQGCSGGSSLRVPRGPRRRRCRRVALADDLPHATAGHGRPPARPDRADEGVAMAVGPCGQRDAAAAERRRHPGGRPRLQRPHVRGGGVANGRSRRRASIHRPRRRQFTHGYAVRRDVSRPRARRS
jgi:hypothetical protein